MTQSDAQLLMEAAKQNYRVGKRVGFWWGAVFGGAVMAVLWTTILLLGG